MFRLRLSRSTCTHRETSQELVYRQQTHTHTKHLRCRLSAAESPQAGGEKSWYRLIVCWVELSASCIHMEEEYRAETRKQISCCERVLYKARHLLWFAAQEVVLCAFRGASERQLLHETSISNRLAPTLRYFSNSNTCTPSWLTQVTLLLLAFSLLFTTLPSRIILQVNEPI